MSLAHTRGAHTRGRPEGVKGWVKGRRMRRPRLSPWVLAALGGWAAAAQGAGLLEAVAQGRAHLDLRARYEGVDDRVQQQAQAGTLRTRLGYATGRWQGLSAYGEFEDVRVILGLGDYAPRRAGYATVADPPVTQLNQAYLDWTAGAGQGPRLKVRLGRQRIKLDNDRFVGNVGWRQNEQTFDALRLDAGLPGGLALSYAFLDKVNGILPQFDADVTDHLLHLARALPVGRLAVYAYLLEDDGSGASNDTYGLRLKGSRRAGRWRLPYLAEAAWQRADAGHAGYLRLEAGAARGAWRAALAWERLGSDGGRYGLRPPWPPSTPSTAGPTSS